MTACATDTRPSSSPTESITIEPRQFDVSVNIEERITAHVLDGTGLVTAVERLAPDRTDDESITVSDAGGVDVRWVGGVCLREPVLEVSGSAQEFVVTLRPDVGVFPNDAPCPDIGMLLGVRLHTSSAIEAAGLSLKIVR